MQGINDISVQSSVSLQHLPVDKNLEKNLPKSLLDRLSFATQKLGEIVDAASAVSKLSNEQLAALSNPSAPGDYLDGILSCSHGVPDRSQAMCLVLIERCSRFTSDSLNLHIGSSVFIPVAHCFLLSLLTIGFSEPTYSELMAWSFIAFFLLSLCNHDLPLATSLP